MRTVAIIGGGIGGLSAALAFAINGADVTVYEQAPALTEVGAGLQLTPNSLRVLQALGRTPFLDKISIPARAVVPTDGLTGHAITRFDLSSQNYRFLHRADLIADLAGACAQHGVKVHLGQKITRISGDVHFFSGDTRCDPDLTVGADGLHSVLRPLLNGPGKPFFTRQVAWRAVIARDAAAEARIWMLPGAHVVTYPLTGGRMNIVAVQERDTWAEEGWNHADDPANLRSAFTESCLELQDILAQVENVKLWGLFRHPVAENWGAEGLALLGDAAHPTLPFLAQGANLAIEDAYALAACCAKGDLEKGLAQYQGLRKARVIRAIKAANANAVNYHLRGARRSLSHLALKSIGAVAPHAFINRMDWLYKYDIVSKAANSHSPGA